MRDLALSVSASTPRVQLLLRQAQQSAVAGQFQTALLLLRSAVAFDTGFVSLNEYGILLLAVDQYDEAQQQFQELLKRAQEGNSLHWQIVALHHLASCYRMQKCWTLASSFQQRALKLLDQLQVDEAEVEPVETEQTDMLSAVLSGLANDAMTRGEFEYAEELLNRSLRYELLAGSMPGQAADLGSLGVLALLRKKPKRAWRLLVRAYRIHVRLGDMHQIGCDLSNMALAAEQLGRWTVAQKLLDRAEARFELAEAPTMVAKVQAQARDVARIAGVRQRDPLLN